MSTITTIPVGNRHEPTPVQNVRTQAQRDVVLSIVRRSDFDFACGNPLHDPYDELRNYTGPFCFVWQTKDSKTHLVRIGKRGNILREINA